LKRFLLIILAICLAAAVQAVPAHASGSFFTLVSTTPVTYTVGQETRRAYTATWQADSANGSVPALAIPVGGTYPIGGLYLKSVETLPGGPNGGTAPTNNYTVTITNDVGGDITGGALATNRSSTTYQLTAPTVVNMPVMVLPGGFIYINVSANLVNSATGWIRITFSSN
jgi:hypothetical protein